ncbi:hypothetical protein KJ575_00625 [Patescibacteria group bacterium]|nr:hypothetical protein [Patescibacteria group bacterium]
MSQVLDKFQNIISESSISLEDQNDILVVLPALPEEAIATLNGIFTREPKMITEFNKSFRAKVRALTNQDDKEWEDILRKEQEQLRELEPLEEAG